MAFGLIGEEEVSPQCNFLGVYCSINDGLGEGSNAYAVLFL